jgi:hypothetical protein
MSMSKTQRSALLTFFALTFGWTWGLWAIVTFQGLGLTGLGAALLLASAFGPSLAAVITVLAFEGQAGFGLWLRRSLRLRVGWLWYAVALLVPPLLILAALGIHAGLGGVLPPSSLQGNTLTAILVFVQITLLGGPLGEEFGWRGYALPALSAPIGWRWGAVVVGGVWAFWHLPLFYMAGMAQANLPMELFMASNIALSIVFARLSVNTRFSVLPAILLHGAINWSAIVLPVMPVDGETRPYTLAVTLLIVAAVIAVLKPGPQDAKRGNPS